MVPRTMKFHAHPTRLRQSARLPTAILVFALAKRRRARRLRFWSGCLGRNEEWIGWPVGEPMKVERSVKYGLMGLPVAAQGGKELNW